MKLHHIGIVCEESDVEKFFFKPKKKFVYHDNFQHNKLIIERNEINNLWIEFVIPKNKRSTVFRFLEKNGPRVHHFGYQVKNLNEQKKLLNKKKGMIYIKTFKSSVDCFGGKIKTAFYYNNNFYIELLQNVKKK